MKLLKENMLWATVRSIVLITTIIVLSSSCKKKDDNHIVKKQDTIYHNPGSEEPDSIYFFIEALMEEAYLWYEYIPNNIDITKYDDPNDLIVDMRYENLDKWSRVVTAQELDASLGSGVNYNIGFIPRFDYYGNLKIIFVYNESPAATLGLQKGNTIKSINGSNPVDIQNQLGEIFFGTSPASYTMVIENNGVDQTYNISKSEFAFNSVLHNQIDTINGRKTGYVVYEGFTEYSEEELNDVFTYFNTNDIDELIVDLRYNGGGYVYLAISLCEMIAPASTIGNTMFTYKFNDILAPAYDTMITFSNHPLNLDLERVFFITTEFTASASEMVINSLTPHMDVFIIGTPSHGKPVGMPTVPFDNYYVLPVAFKTVNASGYGDYFTGLAVDITADEGLAYNWGDPNDPNLAQAYYYIQNESFNFSKTNNVSEKSNYGFTNISPYQHPLMLLK